ncbi:MAG: hypothetical protein K2H30_04010 [Clostridia bacterium]|nr:hypothetical protein [Clostridia bacterium]
MQFVSKDSAFSDGIDIDGALYSALTAGDLPAACLICQSADNSSEKLSVSALFNCGLFRYLLGEYEKSLDFLKQAEILLGNPFDFDISQRQLFIKSLEHTSGGLALLPLDKRTAENFARYALIRVKWLMAICFEKLGRGHEAASLKNFLEQYNIQVKGE